MILSDPRVQAGLWIITIIALFGVAYLSVNKLDNAFSDTLDLPVRNQKMRAFVLIWAAVLLLYYYLVSTLITIFGG